MKFGWKSKESLRNVNTTENRANYHVYIYGISISGELKTGPEVLKSQTGKS